MKLTESKLRSLVREELQRLTEIDDDRMMRQLRHDLTKHPAVERVGKNRIGTVTVTTSGGREFRIKLKDEDPVSRAPSAADPENWKARVSEKDGLFTVSQMLGSTWGYQDLKSFVVKAIENATR